MANAAAEDVGEVTQTLMPAALTTMLGTSIPTRWIQ
jgi:hypothetical protein